MTLQSPNTLCLVNFLQTEIFPKNSCPVLWQGGLPPRAPKLPIAWEAPRDTWLRGHSYTVCVPVSMPLGKQIRGSDCCWNQFWRLFNLLSNRKLVLEVSLRGAACRIHLHPALSWWGFLPPWRLWALAQKGWERQDTGWEAQWFLTQGGRVSPLLYR